MKRILSFLLSAIMLTSIMAGLNLTAYAATSGSCGENVTYTLDTTTGEMTISGTGDMEDYPSTNTPWYYVETYIKSVIINDGVTSIGNYTFSACSNLTNITIPDSITSIGDYAFRNCISLTNIKIPNTVTNIGSYAFDYCKSLENITIPDGITKISNNAFNYCASFTNITIPDSVTSIGNGAFANCSNLTNIKIPDDVTSIGTYAFSWCSSLPNITLPNSVTSVSNYTFFACSKLTDIKIPSKVTSIGDFAFGSCSSLANITLPNSLTSISKSVFDSCISLTEIKIPLKVTSIVNFVFSGCTNLTNVTVPVSVTSIGDYAFRSAGKVAITCSSNSYAKTFAESKGIPTIDCVHNAVDIAAVEPTCTKTGTTAGTYCSDCGEILSGHETVAALGHTVVVTEKAVAATCTETGLTEGRQCSVCNEVLATQETVDALGHTVVTDKAVAPTCAATGLTEGSHCSVCGKVFVAQESVAMKAHTYTTKIVKATTSENGYIEKKCSTCGNVESNTTIDAIKTYKLSTTSYTYNGKVKKPSVTVKDSNDKTLKENVDYTVTYASGCKNVGKYAVKITFNGNYSGSKTLYFTIKPTATSISSLKAGDNKFTVKWKKKTTQVTGYQVQYSTSSKFKSATTKTISKNKTPSYTKTKLKNKKKYYVRVRTYKKVGKTKYYGAWSSAKYVKTK